MAQVGLAAARAAQGQAVEAATTATKAAALLDDGSRTVKQLSAAAALAELYNELKNPQAALALAEKIVARAAPGGLKRIMLEAELARARAQRALGQTAGQTRLLALKREAETRGFLRLARLAEAAAR
jgi:hypothetical protein